MTDMRRIYEIGPITGKEDDNRPEFERVREKLNEAGYYAGTPFDVVPQGHDESRLWAFCMKHSLNHILAMWDYLNEPPRFGIAMLDGWESSEGASIEYELATSLGIPCRPWREWVSPAKAGTPLAADGASQPVFAPAC